MTELVRAENVSKSYGSSLAVDNVSFDIEKGRIMGLIGPNGAGKTTLLKAMLGLTDCQGTLSVLGLDPSHLEGLSPTHDDASPVSYR